MGFEIDTTGLDNLINKMESLEETNSVSFTELFSDSFMKEYTDFGSIQNLIDNSGFKVESEEDFAAIPDEEWDSYIQRRTRFDSWDQMLKTAGEDWLKRKLDL